jgi:high-affinity Fe2+/Pb2+ permease
MEMKIALNVFLIIGAVLLLAAAVVMGFLIFRYITGMRKQGFFGGKKQDEEE